ncbi:S-adenosyl-L-methionine-dependent methyltransferase, partial [Ilyonectria robusta]|uniref:S-adenosyl-L-methionine-dependent methyltransferase n=1 Tax=Ilyonectria robusta TaxID=1079257 RepID=UPI001E8ED45E
LPPNVRFYVEDVEQDWVESEGYDLIHCRYMAGSIADWPALVCQIYENLKPGGWVELQETINAIYSDDETLKPDNALVRLTDNLKKAHDMIGRTLDPAPKFKGWLETTGFCHITEQKFKLPVGMWPKDRRLKEIG